MSSLNAASQVFYCKDLWSIIGEFVNPYWVNPFFPSVEGALLDGRTELLTQEGYQFQSREQVAEFLSHFALNYPLYASKCDFTNIIRNIDDKRYSRMSRLTISDEDTVGVNRISVSIHVHSMYQAGCYE